MYIKGGPQFSVILQAYKLYAWGGGKIACTLSKNANHVSWQEIQMDCSDKALANRYCYLINAIQCPIKWSFIN